jgi:hypothetical protein
MKSAENISRSVDEDDMGRLGNGRRLAHAKAFAALRASCLYQRATFAL